VLSSLLEDLPEDAFPGENSGAVLIEMVVGSSRPLRSDLPEPLKLRGDPRALSRALGDIRGDR
jgi:hypothetical protein